jgi:NAD(P)-dependent dehydrogenase (short-subunit alcohol dehydrogenase family)
MARGIARRLAAAGHSMLIVDRKPDSAAKVAEAGHGQPGSVSALDVGRTKASAMPTPCCSVSIPVA